MSLSLIDGIMGEGVSLVSLSLIDGIMGEGVSLVSLSFDRRYYG